MIIFLTKSQLALFDAPIHIGAHVRKDGTVVKPHIRIQKIAAKPAQHALFGGHDEPAPAKKRTTKLDTFITRHGGVQTLGRTLAALTEGQQQRLFAEMAKLDGKDPAEVAAMFGDLAIAAPAPVADAKPDLFNQPEPASPPAAPEPTDRNHIQRTGDKLADYWANSASASIERDVKAGRTKKVKVGRPKAKPADQVPVNYANPAPAPSPKESAPSTAPAINHDPAAPFGVAAGTSKAKRREINAAVIAALETEAPDAALLRQYSGNGGCGDSLNEFYTDKDVARSMWTALRTLGFGHGTALEPSCATGVFLHTAPQGVRVTGVELDPVSAKVAGALHGDRHEIVTASLERFATTDDRQFDVVIGNPPYGPRGFLAKDDKKAISTAEQYFTDTALDKAKAGGLVALVVPTGIMDSKSARGFREDMLRKGEFLGAMRMPNTAFEHSHTEVTTDVVFLRKRPDDVSGALATVDQDTLKLLGVWDDEFLAGSYFTGRGASNILGTMTDGWRAKAGMGQDITVEGSMQGVPAAIAAFTPDSVSAKATELTVPEILLALGDDEAAKDRVRSGALRRPYARTAKAGDTKTVDGITYVLQGEPGRWHRVDEFMQAAAIADAAALATEIDGLFTGKTVDRPALQAGIEAYIAKHGIPADNADLMAAARSDKKLFRLIGAVNRQGELSDAVSGRAPRRTEGSLDAVAQTMAVERESGLFSAADLAERMGKPLDEIEDQLAADPRYAFAGAGQWTTMEAYLTGELWPKLDAVRAGGPPALADKLRMQAERLEKVIDAKSLDDVDVQMNSGFVPSAVLAAFLNWRNHEGPGANDWTKKQLPITIRFEDGLFRFDNMGYGDANLIDKYLNRTGVKKDDKDKLDALNADFKEWLCGSQYRDDVEDRYNRTFRGFVPREYSNEPIDVPGLTKDRDVRDWRWSSLRRSLATGKGIIADDVGLGKTLGGLLLARMAKLQGSAQKPVIVVPKSVLANWYAESQTWFPGSRVLTIGATFGAGKDGELVGKDDSAAERKRKYHDLTQNDYDFIFISEPAFEEIDLDPVTKENYYSDDFWVQRGEALGNAGDKRRKAIREKYEQHIAQREFSDRTDAIWFNELGIDMLIADEMHHQKNLYAARARFGEQPKFLGGQGLSNRALDFNLKTRWVREQNGGKNVHGLTATPTKNSPLEIYSMLSHIAPEAFERIKIRNSEEFLDRFCEFTGDKVLSTAGAIEDAQVVSGFKNLDELREIMARFIDRRTAEQVGLVLPERQDRMHLVEMTKAQHAVYADLRDLAEKSAGKKDSTGDAHIFSIMDKMNKAALDLELLDPAAHAGASSPKYAALAKEALEGAKTGGQIVFSEYVDSHEKIVAALVDAGFKRTEIGIINAKVAGSAVKRQNIADAFNAGKLKVVIGNCTMAEGLNLQKGTSDIHHMDLPWEPATMQQRNGRGLRQGNTSEAVRIHSYLSQGSFDGYRYQAIAAKKDWQDLLWNGGDRVENLAREGNISLDDMRIMLAADPDAARAKFAEDKAAAMQRFEAGARTEANAQFVRFQEMTRSYRALKNKGTVSAERLRQKMESTKTSLFNNKYFPAKAALDKDGDVLIQPSTGEVLTAGVGLNTGKDGKWVVTGVNSRAGTVSMRRHADIAGGRPVTVPLAELDSEAATFQFDEAAEAAEVGAALEKQAGEKLNGLTKWADVKAMPSAVLERNHDLIQQQIKAQTKGYTGFSDLPYGSVPMVDKATGAIKMAESYAHTKMHDTHDYLLPTDAAKDKAVQAWIEERRNSTLGVEYISRTRGPGSRSGVSDRAARRIYKNASYNSKNTNPIKGLLGTLSDVERSYGIASPLEKKARARLLVEQQQSIRRAGSAAEAIEHLMPLAKVHGKAENGYADDGKHLAEFPREALAMAWARARHLGQLDAPVQRGAHSEYAYAGGMGGTAHAALIRMARASGHHDLADAFAATGERHGVSKDDAATLAALTGHGATKHGLETAKKIAHRMGVTDKTLSELGSLKLGGVFGHNPHAYDWGARQRAGTKFGDLLDSQLSALTAKEAA